MVVREDGRIQLTLEGLQQDENYTVEFQEIGGGNTLLTDPFSLCKSVSITHNLIERCFNVLLYTCMCTNTLFTTVQIVS